MVGLVEEAGHKHGVEHPIQMTIATSDGTNIWAFRYSSEGDSRSLYFSTRMDSLQALYPENEQLAGLSEETRVVVSEPLGDLAGAWNEVPESHYGIVQPGQDVLEPFAPRGSAQPGCIPQLLPRHRDLRRSSAVIRWSASAASSPRSISTQLTRPLNSVLPGSMSSVTGVALSEPRSVVSSAEKSIGTVASTRPSPIPSRRGRA